jgi:hypothetical protein
MSFRSLVAFAPLVFLAHFAEEAPGFVRWFNAHVERGMTMQSFLQVNAGVLVVTLIVAAVVWMEHSAAPACIAVAWLAFMMGGNAVVHIAATIIDGRYVPGFVTAVVVYVPYFALVLLHARRRGIPAAALLLATLLGAMPMLLQGYRVLFLGSRLF